MKKLLLAAALVLSASAQGADEVVWSCKINDADTYVKLVRGDDDLAIVTPFGQRLPAHAYHDGVDLRWLHRDGETIFEIVIQPTFEAGFYDFSDVDQGESTFPEYRMKCEKRSLSEQEQIPEGKEIEARLKTEELKLMVADHYIHAIRQKVERNWIKPVGGEEMPLCKVHIVQGPGGTILDVKFGVCGGSASYRASIESAVYKSEPLPAPEDPALFERELNFYFDPSE